MKLPLRRTVLFSCALQLGALFLAGFPCALPAAEPLRLTLSSAIKMALDENLDIEVESYSPEIEKQRVRIEGGTFDPVLQGSFTHDETALASPSAVDEKETGRVGVNGRTPWGMSYDLGASSVYSWQSGAGGGWSFSPEAALRQPLLRGFGTDVNLASLRIARRSLAQSEWALRNQVTNSVTEVHLVYNRLYQALQNYDVAVRFQELASVLLRDNEKRVEIGVMSPLDVTQARAQVAQRQENLIVTAAAVEDAKMRLKQLLFSDYQKVLSTGIEIVPPRKAIVGTIQVQNALNDAFAWRADYRQALLDLEKRKIQVVFQKNQTLPQLDLVGSLELLGLDQTFSESLSRSVNESNRQAWSAGAQFSIPIPNRSAKGRYEVAKLQEIQALADFKRLELQIVVDVDAARREIQTSRERIVSTREARILAEESLRAAAERLKAGSGTTFEVLELQRDLAQAEASEVSAFADYNRAVAEFDRVTGMTLQRNGIEFAHASASPTPAPKKASSKQ